MPHQLLRTELRASRELRRLPPAVAWFHFRARLRARRVGDEFSLLSASPPAKLATLLSLAEGRHRVAELGTATGWTAAALAVADRKRRVTTYDPVDRPERELYLRLVGVDARARIEYLDVPGASDPRPAELLYIDSSHGKSETIEEVEAWAEHLLPGALIVFDDYAHPDYPGVREAVRSLGLVGVRQGELFVHQVL